MAVSRAKLAQLVSKAVAAFGDLRTTITYRSITPGVYDPVTDTTTDVSADTTIENCILAGLTSTEYGWFPADRNTQKLIIPTLALGVVVPKETDRVIIGSDEWEISKIKSPTGGAVSIIYIELS